MVCFINSRQKRKKRLFCCQQRRCFATPHEPGQPNTHTHTHLLSCLRPNYLCMQYPGNHSIREVRHHLLSPTAETDPNINTHTGVKDTARYNIMLNQSENSLKWTFQVTVTNTWGFYFLMRKTPIYGDPLGRKGCYKPWCIKTYLFSYYYNWTKTNTIF